MVYSHPPQTHAGFGLWFIFAVLALVVSSTDAANVRLEISSREVYVDVPFALNIIVEDAGGITPEVDIPSIPELAFIGEPSQSSNSYTQIINGRITQSESITLTYQAISREEGVLSIPAIMITVGDDIYYTRPVELSAIQSVSGDLVFARVVSERDTYYLGETFPVVLEIWLRPFVDQQYNIRLDKQNMWNTLSRRASSFGIFSAQERNITVRESQQNDEQGNLRVYYVYSIETLITPRQAGAIPLDDVRVVVNYPTSLRRRQSFFEDRLEIADSRPIVVPLERTSVRVIPPPVEDQPDIFTGAVGQFSIDVSASPTQVSVGDPITLTITIHDETDGASRLEDLQPPPLDRIPTLENDFRIPSDPLAGIVEGKSKRFTQTIRPVHDRIEAVPPIPFAYFDPAEKLYHTVHADPIPLQVKAASQMSLSDVVDANGSLTDRQQTELTEVEGGLLANFTEIEELLAQHRQRMPRLLIVCLLVIPPFLYIGLLAVQLRMKKRHGDPSYQRYRDAFRTAKKQLNQAQSENTQCQAEVIGTVMRTYIADRCRLISSSITTEEAILQLRENHVSSDLIKNVEQLLLDCEQLTFAGHASEGSETQIPQAMSCLKKLEREI